MTGLRQLSIAEMMIDVADTLKASQIGLDVINEGMTNQWPDKVQNVIAEVLREAITNVINYSHADQVQVIFAEATMIIW
ncbi:hypothetical protein KTE19_06435 [Lentilactobacillus sp. IMAU92037]|uniref:hypothetical protein n=1 Tax=Lentilactobacillus TaxID=2767893 RepID=UPI001C25B30C|nr:MULTISPECIES: hypothetical protein [Lentilactobacillus]MBU9790249.1 hypothetical protein [Lentilactobacillus dabitei]MBV0930351.1 hypothetical protein [Lentilactobacillus dabitei]MDM7517132.1 hypothetical protein [Lentilactobacillus sp. TOM.63]